MQLRSAVSSMDHRGYPSLKSLAGAWDFGTYTLFVDHVQGDPFASPSNLHVEIPGSRALFPRESWESGHRRLALEDFLLRRFSKELQARSFKTRGSGKSGLLATTVPGQEVLARSAIFVDPKDGSISAGFEAGFPAFGRSVAADELIRILTELVPEAVERSLYWRTADQKGLRAALELADDRLALRAFIEEQGLCAFVADGSVLPRESGVSHRPMQGAVPFTSPDSLAVTAHLPHRGDVRGMGLRRGVTLIVGGGYHGKSTLLLALQEGVYDHIAGDGRELVVADPGAVKIRSEDGRSIVGTDISMFIRDLPGGRDTVSFSTQDASGSTSQAAGIVEALESGAKTLLIDEDTSATNLMVRDEIMQRVISRDQEPITPYIERVRDLWEREGVSTILVAGSSGAWFSVADCVIQMDHYRPFEITRRAKETAEALGAEPDSRPAPFAMPDFRRVPLPGREFSGERLKTRSDKDSFSIDHTEVDLRALEQLVDGGQCAALAKMLVYAQRNLMDGRKTLRQVADGMYALLQRKGLRALGRGSAPFPGLAMPRRAEFLAAVDRYRKLRLK